jgi:hypothetical protein
MLVTLQVIRKPPAEPFEKQHKYLTEEVPDLGTYEIVKEEFPNDLIEAFDVI